MEAAFVYFLLLLLVLAVWAIHDDAMYEFRRYQERKRLRKIEEARPVWERMVKQDQKFWKEESADDTR